MYLAAGASDVATEIAGEDEPEAARLEDALERQWAAMVDSKQYLTGGLGSRWDGEAFGDPFELPPDVAYAETCASVGAVQWAWRRLLSTGRASYADTIEKVLLNGFLSGVSLSGEEFFYVNALQVRDGAVPHDHRHPVTGRQRWFRVACCPPNVMRTLSQLGGYLGHHPRRVPHGEQYAAGTLQHRGREAEVETDYPWDGHVSVRGRPGTGRRTDRRRVDVGAAGAGLVRGGHGDGPRRRHQPTHARLRRGDPPLAGGRHGRARPADAGAADPPHPRVDAVRGCRAIERGPLVHAVEQVDLPDGPAVDDLRLSTDDPSDLHAQWRPDLLDGCVVVTGEVGSTGGATATITAVPYALWANRGGGPMRVWLPLAEEGQP